MLVLSETVLVLVIESSVYRCYVRSTHELPLNETKLVRLSEHEHEHEHENENENENEHGHGHGHEPQSGWLKLFLQ